MPVDYGLDHYRLDRGIDSISRSTRQEVPLPDAAYLPPAAQPIRPELERLLWRPNLQDYLAEQLQPQIADRQLLTPQLFERTLRAAVGRLRSLAAREERAGRAPLLGKAAQTLAEEASLRELLNMYRSTLYQG